MEQTDQINILDNENIKTYQKKLWTIRLLKVGGGIIALTFIIATFWEALGLNRAYTVWLAFSMMLSFGINLAGFIVGFVEQKKNNKRALFGIIGNFILIVFFIAVVTFSFVMMSELH